MSMVDRISDLIGSTTDPFRQVQHHYVAGDRVGVARRLDVTSPSIENGHPIPARHAGPEGTSPALRIHDIPQETRQLAILCEDPDAPKDTFVHWLAYGIEPTTKLIDEGVPPRGVAAGFKQGRNSLEEDGFTGPAPPPDGPPHHYHFQVFALDTTIGLPPGADRESLILAMTDHVLAHGDLVGTYRA